MRKGFVVCLWLLVALSFVGTGCAKKKLDSMPAGATSRAGELSDQDLARRRAEEQALREREMAERAARDAAARAGKGDKVFSDSQFARDVNADLIYFDYDSFDLKPESRQVLQKKGEMLKSHPEAQLVIEGHSDERGTNEYNLALGERRAKAALDFLVLMGVPADSMRTVSYGEERPACSGSGESCYSKNRRDEFKVLE
jgi:peptidoglycan-associated lipoprotein